MFAPQLIFSGGTGRSGTTVLAKLLRTHPDVFASRPLEIRCATDSVGVLDVCLGPRRSAPASVRLLAASQRAMFAAFTSRMRGRWWERTNRLGKTSGLHRGLTVQDREALIASFRENLRHDRKRAGEKFLVELAQRQGLETRPYWIDTSPPNIAQADRIHAIAPTAKFVHMVRDGRDSMASVLAETWGPNNASEAARWWAERMAAADRALRAVPEEQVLTVALEELVVTDRVEQYQRLLDFLELPNRPRMRRYFNERMPAQRVRPGSWRERVSDPLALESAYQVAAEGLRAAGVPTHEHP